MTARLRLNRRLPTSERHCCQRACCMHRTLVAHAEGQGRCLDCRLVVFTPFTIHAAA
jgi:hypothetical protein